MESYLEKNCFTYSELEISHLTHIGCKILTVSVRILLNIIQRYRNF